MSRKGLRYLAYLTLVAGIIGLLVVPRTAPHAQQAPPAPQAPQAPPAPQTPPGTQVATPAPDQTTPPKDKNDIDPTEADMAAMIHEEVHIVTTPVTVQDSTGQPVYDLQQEEFKIYDNGQLEDIKGFDSEMDQLSLVIVVETNDSTAPFLDSVRPLASLFSEMVMGPQGKVAVITYSDRVRLALDFTADGDKLDNTLRGLQGRGSGMHVDDALVAALSKLNHQPLGDRKVIIAFSDGFNIGSKMHRGEIVKGAMNSNITIYSLGFSPATGLWKRQPHDPPPDLVSESVGRGMPANAAPTPTAEADLWNPNDIDIVPILLGIGEEVKKPIFKDSMIYFSRYSGGRSYQKWDKNTVQATLSTIGAEIHSQYEVSYSPSTPVQPGFHKIEVEVRRPGAKVRARSGWFYQGDVPRGVRVK